MKFCLIGEKLGHSFSVPIHRFYGAEYELREIARDSLGDFVKNCPFDGFNVTIPYKTEIMRYLARGRTKAHIAGVLYVSENTVRSHVRNIYAKLEVHTRQQLIDLVEEERGADGGGEAPGSR